MRQSKYLFFAILLLTSFIAGCNLFSFTNPTSSSTDYLSDGQQKYWDGDYSGAVDDFAAAIEEDSQNGIAYWWHAKALVRTTGYTPITLVNMMTEIDTMSSTLPFMDWSADSANTLYQVMFGVNDDLYLLFYDSVSTDELEQVDIALDYALGLIIQGVLMLRDTNVDSVIDESDINLGAFFQDGEFEIPDDQWDLLSDADKEILIDNVIFIIDQFVEVTFVILEEIAGIDVDELRDTADDIRDGLDERRP
ncbi:MAG: hypothetical protein GY839_04435 [candidate division Zixibacteria bacterium]|nr:hypothetical protein [candidate division Zixibacteria bacterium]